MTTIEVVLEDLEDVHEDNEVVPEEEPGKVLTENRLDNRGVLTEKHARQSQTTTDPDYSFDKSLPNKFTHHRNSYQIRSKTFFSYLMIPDENDYQFNCNFDPDLDKILKKETPFGYDTMNPTNFLIELNEVESLQSLKKITNKFLNNYLRFMHKIFRYHIPLCVIKFLSIMIEKKFSKIARKHKKISKIAFQATIRQYFKNQNNIHRKQLQKKDLWPFDKLPRKGGKKKALKKSSDASNKTS